MNTLFSGHTRSRPAINLSGNTTGSASSSSSSYTPESTSIASKARSERQARESQRRLDRAARVIQRWYRSNKLAGSVREDIRRDLDSHLDILSKNNTTDVVLLEATTKLAFVFREHNRADVARLGRWARIVAVGKPRVKLFQGFVDLTQDMNLYTRWTHALSVLSRRMCKIAAISPSLPSVPLFLELVKQLLDLAKYKDLPANAQDYPSELAISLVRAAAMQDLRQHILSWPAHTRPLPPSLGPTIAIAVSTISRISSNHESYSSALQQFIQSILTIPQLTSSISPRLPGPALQSLIGDKATIPYFDILASIVDANAVADGLQSAHLLSNLVNIGRNRLEKGQLKNGKELSILLTAYKLCLEKIPSNLLATPNAGASDLKGKSRETAIDLNVDDDGDFVMDNTVPKPSTISKLDSSTYNTLLSLTKDPFLSSIIRTSTHFSATTRPALFSFLVSLLYTFPSSIKENMINLLVYSSQAGGSSRGLLREIWRGWIRSSNLSKALSQGSTSGSITTSVINALSNQTFGEDWANFVLLAEMYARCLLTLGDDEFYSRPINNSTSVGESEMSRNPLMIDGVIGLSALWRNVAFALYWQPEVLNAGAQGGERKVVGTRVPIEGLRKLATGLLQSLHTRDSRRQFTPPNHWIMTSQMDLQSFIESAIVEDQKLDEDEADQPVSTSNSRSYGRRGRAGDSDEDMDEDELPRPQATVRRNLPSRRQMAFVSPRLGVLNNIPFVIPFDVRVSIFQQFIANDRVRLQQIQHPSIRNRFSVGSDGRRIAAAATIRRGHVADDGFATLSGLGSQLKERLAIRFMDQYGQEEAGIDGGGLFKEFLTELSKEAFDVDRGLWLETPNHELYPASTSYSRESFSLQWYAFLGRIMGKALYEGILVDVPFAPFFLSKWLGRSSGFDDLASFEPELYHGLVQLKNYPGDVEKDLSLNFTVTDDDFGVSRTIELIPNGSNTPVTNENRISYIYRVSDYRLNKQIFSQCSAFFSGLSDLIDPKWLRMFNTVELGLLVGGAETSIDIDDLRHNTVYSRGFDESHETVQYFWKVVNDFNQEDKKALVKFCTSCPRPPLLGFGQLNPKFALGNGGADEDRMPSTSTCVNLLKLPTYSSPEKLKQKLLASIHSGAGFDLS